jgi:hypothetical protein
VLNLGIPIGATEIPGGYGLSVVLNEQHLEELARLTLDVLRQAILVYSDLAAPSTPHSSEPT